MSHAPSVDVEVGALADVERETWWDETEMTAAQWDFYMTIWEVVIISAVSGNPGNVLTAVAVPVPVTAT